MSAERNSYRMFGQSEKWDENWKPRQRR